MTNLIMVNAGEAHAPVPVLDSVSRVGSSDLVLAWAKDMATGEPRHIGELRKEQTGLKCGCKCYSCDLPLEAVNAGKTEYKLRPHFRHPDGAPKGDCMVLTARVVALELLIRDGRISLPRRRKSAEVVGLSGKYHDAWVEHPRELVSIADARHEDRVTAIVTLEDGRQFRIGMVGSVEASDSNDTRTGIPTIRFVVDDPVIADMSPEELRKRVTKIVDEGLWCSHWNDKELAQQALEAAKQYAIDRFDWNETLLHLKAKEILETEKRLRLPNLLVEAETVLHSGTPMQKSSKLEGLLVSLDSVTLEKPLGQIKPDVYATTIEIGDWPSQQILIEVTVTNTITEERLERIKTKNLPTLEIDISRMGGMVTFDEYRRLVVDEVAGKRWLHHPWMVQEQRRLEAELRAEVDAAIVVEKRKAVREAARRALLEAPIERLGQDYLGAIEVYGWHRARAYDGPSPDKMPMAVALNKVYDYAKALADRGYPEAEDPFLFTEQGNILDRLMSFKMNRAVGYKVDTAWQVINAILQEKAPHLEWHTLFLSAIKAYQPTLSSAQEEKVVAWRCKVVDSLHSGQDEYRRTSKYDRFISFLFPEMAKMLQIVLPGSKRQRQGEVRRSVVPVQTERFQWTSGRAHYVDLAPNDWKIADFGDRWRARGFSVDSALVECSIRQRATWSEIVSVWSKARLIDGHVSYEAWKSAHPEDVKWLVE